MAGMKINIHANIHTCMHAYMHTYIHKHAYIQTNMQTEVEHLQACGATVVEKGLRQGFRWRFNHACILENRLVSM